MTNIFRGFEARRKVWFMFLEFKRQKRQGERYELRVHQLSTNKQDMSCVNGG